MQLIVYMHKHHIAGTFGSDNVWQIDLINDLAKKVWRIAVQSNCYVVCMWYLNGFSLAKLCSVAKFAKLFLAKHSHYMAFSKVRMVWFICYCIHIFVTIQVVILVRLSFSSPVTCLFIDCMLMELFTPLVKFLNQVCADRRPWRAWFFEIVRPQTLVCLCVCPQGH